MTGLKTAARYVPGSWVAIGSTDLWLLIEADPGTPLILRLWQLIRSNGSVDDILGAILGEGFRIVGNFALVSGAERRLVVRGHAQAQLSGSADIETISARDVRTWLDRHLEPSVTGARLSAAPIDHGWMPISSGVVAAASLEVSFEAGEEVHAHPSAAGAQEPAHLDDMSFDEVPSEAMPQQSFAEAEPQPPAVKTQAELDAVAVEPGLKRGTPAPPSEWSADDADLEPAAKVVLADVTPSSDVVEPAPLTIDLDPEPPVIGRRNEPDPFLASSRSAPEPLPADLSTVEDAPKIVATAANPSPANPSPAAPSFDHLFGSTQDLIVAGPPASDDAEQEAERSPATLAGEELPPHDPALIEPLRSHRSDIETLPPVETESLRDASEIIDALPWQVPDAAPGAAVPLPPAPMSSISAVPTWHDDLPVPPPPTFVEPPVRQHVSAIDRVALLAAAGDVPRAGPTVLAARCPSGHLSPAYAGACRICGDPLASNGAFTAPRPVLGVLVLSTGDRVALDRGVILGRAPEPPDPNDPDRPHVVQLASPGNDISRTHAEVRIDGWHVLVVDLDSTNGTVVTPPGQPPQRLRARDPIAIEPGAEVSLADEVSFRYELPS